MYGPSRSASDSDERSLPTQFTGAARADGSKFGTKVEKSAASTGAHPFGVDFANVRGIGREMQ
jgi:hypothetical protein